MSSCLKRRRTRREGLFFAGTALLAMCCVGSASAEAQAEPELLSVFPLGGRQGTTYRAAIRGHSLAGAYAVWFAGEGIHGEVLSVEEEGGPNGNPKKGKAYPIERLSVSIRLKEEAAPGEHSFQVLTPRGISNPLKLYVHSEPSVPEQAESHDLPREAQSLASLPLAVHGRIQEIGEVDYYSFVAEKGQELRFEAFSSDPLDPGIALYELTGSWFDEDRAIRLAFHDDPVSYPGLSTEAALTYRFEKDGDFLVRVSGFWGYGGPDHSYLLRITPAEEGTRLAKKEESNDVWSERTWTRRLDPDRMEALWSRAVPALALGIENDQGKPREGAVPAMEEIPVFDADAEPTKLPIEPPVIPLPALVVGTVERPGDIDRVRFSVKGGDKLVLEVETPGRTIPLMNPYLRVVDSEGVEAFTNVYSRVNANGNISKQIQPKTAYAFPRDGEFTLEIRDITANYGDREMRYRVLVRPQVPHVGEVYIEQDRLNLIAGRAKKLSVITDQEEGYEGFVILTIEGLPEGVSAAMGTEVEPDSPPAFNEGKKERFTTKSKKATFVVLPDANAPATRAPVSATVFAQPVMEGQLGERFMVKKLLVMVTQQREDISENLKRSVEGSR